MYSWLNGGTSKSPSTRPFTTKTRRTPMHVSHIVRLFVSCLILFAVMPYAVVGAHHGHQYPYVLVDLPTLGGPQSSQGNFPFHAITNHGLVGGVTDLATPIHYPNDSPAFNGDPYVQ